MKRIVTLFLFCSLFAACIDQSEMAPEYGYVVELDVLNDSDMKLYVECKFPYSYSLGWVIDANIDSSYRASGKLLWGIGKGQNKAVFFDTFSMEAPVSSYEEFVEWLSLKTTEPLIIGRSKNDMYEELGVARLSDCVAARDEYDIKNRHFPQLRRHMHVTTFTIRASNILEQIKPDA